MRKTFLKSVAPFALASALGIYNLSCGGDKITGPTYVSTPAPASSPVSAPNSTPNPATTPSPENKGYEIKFGDNGFFRVTNTSDGLQHYKLCNFVVTKGGGQSLIDQSQEAKVSPNTYFEGNAKMEKCNQIDMIWADGETCKDFSHPLGYAYYLDGHKVDPLDSSKCDSEKPEPSPSPSPSPSPTAPPPCDPILWIKVDADRHVDGTFYYEVRNQNDKKIWPKTEAEGMILKGKSAVFKYSQTGETLYLWLDKDPGPGRDWEHDAPPVQAVCSDIKQAWDEALTATCECKTSAD